MFLFLFGFGEECKVALLPVDETESERNDGQIIVGFLGWDHLLEEDLSYCYKYCNLYGESFAI